MEKVHILSSETVLSLAPGTMNPRNSEGDFAVLKDGSILFVYSRYCGDSAHDDAKCNLAGMISEDNGKSFRPLPDLLVTADSHGVENVMSVSLHRLADGTLGLFYLCKFHPYSAVFMRRADPDERSFGEAEVIVPKEKGIYYVINNNRVCALADGTLLFPVAVHRVRRGQDGALSGEYFGKARIFASDENGRNPHPVSGLISMPHPGHSGTGLQEPGITVLPDGRLYGYFRTDRGFHFESFSSDNGKTWTKPVQSRFTGPDSPLLIARNPYSNIYYAVWNPIPNYNGRITPGSRWVHAGRTPLVMAQSENGIDFSAYTVIEDDPAHGYCYPALHFIGKTEMLLSYCAGGEEDGTCLNRTTIRRITVSE